MKPDWSTAPEWANYAAQELSGSFYWYSHKPKYSEICCEWQSPGQRQIIPRVEFRPQTTLEERPPHPDPITEPWRYLDWARSRGHFDAQQE